jgi:hypothetical protein
MTFGQPKTRRQLGARLIASNPTPGPYPQWTPKPLPQSVQFGNTTFSLQKFQVGVKDPDTRHWFYNPQVGGTALLFRIREVGATRHGWKPIYAELTNATGDTLQGGFTYGGKRTPSGLFAPWSVGTEESAWKIGVHFLRTTGFTPAETWSFDDIRLPAPSLSDTAVNSVLTRGGTQIRLRQLRLSRKSKKQWEVHMQFQSKAELADSITSILRIDSEDGRNFLHFGDNPRYINSPSSLTFDRYSSLSFDVPPNTKKISLKLAVHRTHLVNFLAAPTTP